MTSFLFLSRARHSPGQVSRGLWAAFAAVLAFALFSGCGKTELPTATAKISVYKDGGLIVSGFRTDPDKFSVAVDHMREKRTTVWLYREPGEGVGAAIERSVRSQLAAAGIPVHLYADEGFTQPKKG